MRVSSKTKIADIIKANEKAIDVIAAINPHFRKLKNPILRKLLAPRVNVEQAANIGKTTVNTILNKLKELNFEIEECDCEKENNIQEINSKEEIINEEDIVSFDVRPIIKNGEDPLKAIMVEVKKLPLNKTLLIINSFEPIPLINLLREKGFSASVQKIEEDIIYTYFTKKEDKINIESENLYGANNDFDEKLHVFKDKLKEIDVRSLEMPGPMVAILAEINDLKSGEALLVHHKRIPQFLLPELNTLGFNYLFNEIEEGYLKILIFKKWVEG